MATSKDEKSPLLLIVSALVAVSTALVVGLLFWSDENGSAELEPGLVDQPPPPVEGGSETEVTAALPGTESSVDGRGRGELSERSESASLPSGESDPEPPDFADYLDRTSIPVDASVKEELRGIADSSASQEQKVAKFKSYFRSRNDAGAQMLAVRHLSKLVKDEQYNEFLADELMDPNHSEAVKAALVRDINGRARQVMLPVMVEIAALPEHPLKKYAHQTLGRHLGDGYNADPEALRRAVNDYMRESADGL